MTIHNVRYKIKWIGLTFQATRQFLQKLAEVFEIRHTGHRLKVLPNLEAQKLKNYHSHQITFPKIRLKMSNF